MPSSSGPSTPTPAYPRYEVDIHGESHLVADSVDSGAGAGLEHPDVFDADAQRPGWSGVVAAPVLAAEREDPEEEGFFRPPRKPLCSCRCCRLNVHTVSASCTEVDEMFKSMRHLMLKQDVLIGGELIATNSHLLSVGSKWRRRGAWEISSEIEEAATVQLRDCAQENQNVRLTFKCPQQAMPWCLILKFPCSVCFMTVVLVLALCAAGISPSVTIDTNFDSFMESDSTSSLNWNTYLDAIQSRNKERRRLQEASSSMRRWQDWWDMLQEMAEQPVLDECGHWFPLRSLARMFFGKEHRDHVTWTPRSTERRLGTQLYKQTSLQITYATKKSGESILTKELMSEVHRIEARIKGMSQWVEMCESTDPASKKFCNPGVSFANLVFPVRSEEGTQTKLFFNGSGAEFMPLELAIGFAKSQGVLPLMFPDEQAGLSNFHVDSLSCSDLDSASMCSSYKKQGQCRPFAEHNVYMQDFCAQTCNFCGPAAEYSNSSGVPVDRHVITALRANFQFESFCCTSDDSGSVQSAGKAKIDKLWKEMIANLVEMMANEEQDGDVRVLYSGDSVDGFEAMAAIQNDVKWAAASYTFVLFYCTYHTRSILLSFVGLGLVMLSIPSALSLFAMASGSQSVSLISCLSIFIVIGVGSDTLFVYTDFWKQSVQHSRDPVARLKFTYAQAAVSTAAATFTAAMSFLANLASVLRPLREFGFFMGACMVMAWLIVLVAYPPILVLGERCHRRISRTFRGSRDEEARQPAPASPGESFGKSFSKSTSEAMAVLLNPDLAGVDEEKPSFLGDRLSPCLRAWKCLLLLAFLIMTLGCLALSLNSLEQASGVPQIFHPEHNQVMALEYNKKFISFDADIANKMVPSAKECNNLFEECSQFRCESTGQPMGSATECPCARDSQHGCRIGQRPTHVSVIFRVVGRQGLPANAVNTADFTSALKTQFPTAKLITPPSPALGTMVSDCLVENWESGQRQLGTVMTPGQAEVIVRDLDPGEAEQRCIDMQVCYCGVARCEGSSFVLGLGTLKLGELAFGYNWSPAGRRLEEVRRENLVDVSVMFGIKVIGSTPLLGVSADQPWEYDLNFNLQDPWAQRRLETMCLTLDNETAMHVMSSRCWLLGFRDWWVQRGHDWPMRPTEDLHKEVEHYAANEMIDGLLASDFLWFENGKVMATYVVFFLNVPKTVSSNKAMEIMGSWDKYFESFNAKAEKAIKGAWHASKLWVRAEAEKVILDSTVVTLGISLGCVFLGLLIFTRSMHLAFLVLLVVMGIIICLLFFMTVVMSWPVGAIEVLSLIVFVGYAVNYCLHVAHKYHTCHINAVCEDESADEDEAMQPIASESPHTEKKKRPSITLSISDSHKPKAKSDPNKRKNRPRNGHHLLAQNRAEERFARTKYALGRIGPAVIGSSITTAGCAAFLLPCQLAVFTKIGLVVMAVTFLAIVYTILPLPALLMLCGPCSQDFPGCVRGAKRLIGAGDKSSDRNREAPQEDIPGTRRYVLHMPTRGMADVGVGMPATRTRIVATG